MALYRVRMEETEEEKHTMVSYATFHVDPLDDPRKVFERLRRSRALQWVHAPEEDESDVDSVEFYGAPEFVAEDEPGEPPVRGNPSDFGLQQMALV